MLLRYVEVVALKSTMQQEVPFFFFLNKKVNNLNMVFGPFQIDRQSAAVRIGLGDDTEEALSF